MEQRDETTMKNSENKPPSSQNPSKTPSNATNNEPEIVNREGFPDSETININHSDPSSPSPPPREIPDGDDISNPKSTSVPKSLSNNSDDDLPKSSMAGRIPAIQNPPVQVMARTEEHETPTPYRIPSRVFRRTNTGAPDWSNESLFSIQMGNMSFTKELEWLNSEMPGDPLPPLTSNINININNNGYNTSNQIQSNNLYKTSKGDQIQVNGPIDNINRGYQIQANKFSDMSQNVGKFHQDYDEMTEAKAAEMMRQVIMENSKDYDLSCASGTSRVDGSNQNNNGNDVSHHSDNNAKSHAFNIQQEGGTSQSSPKELVQGKPEKTEMQTETETPRESSRVLYHNQATKPCSDYSCKCLDVLCKCLCCCFTCCIR